jgi:hypothetical protein
MVAGAEEAVAEAAAVTPVAEAAVGVDLPVTVVAMAVVVAEGAAAVDGDVKPYVDPGRRCALPPA